MQVMGSEMHARVSSLQYFRTENSVVFWISRTFFPMIHRTTGEGGGYLFKFSIPYPSALQKLLHWVSDCCREFTCYIFFQHVAFFEASSLWKDYPYQGMWNTSMKFWFRCQGFPECNHKIVLFHRPEYMASGISYLWGFCATIRIKYFR